MSKPRKALARGDVSDHPLPLITEKATQLSEQGQFVFRVALGCDQAGDQGGGRGFVRRQRAWR